LDPDGGEDEGHSASSQSRSLLEVRFLRVLVSTNVGYLIHLHGVKVFDKAVRLTHGMDRPYGRTAAIPVVTKASVVWLFAWFLPQCENNCN
jgi:hypothetical protein